MFLEMMTQMRRNVIYSMFMFQPQTDPAPQAATAWSAAVWGWGCMRQWQGWWRGPECEWLWNRWRDEDIDDLWRPLPRCHRRRNKALAIGSPVCRRLRSKGWEAHEGIIVTRGMGASIKLSLSLVLDVRTWQTMRGIKRKHAQRLQTLAYLYACQLFPCYSPIKRNKNDFGASIRSQIQPPKNL